MLAKMFKNPTKKDIKTQIEFLFVEYCGNNGLVNNYLPFGTKTQKKTEKPIKKHTKELKKNIHNKPYKNSGKKTKNPVMWIRSDPESFGSVDPDSESRGIKSLIK